MLLSLMVAAAAATGVLLIFMALVGWRPLNPVQARLAQLGAGARTRTLEEMELERPIFDRTVRPMLGRLARFAQRLASPKRVSRTEKRLAMAGYPAGLRTIDFLALRLLAMGVTGAVVFIVAAVAGAAGLGMLLGAGGGALGFFLPEYWLSRRVRKRQHKILLAVADTLDLLTISVRAGLSFDGALSKVVEKTTGPLADEFRRVLAEIRVGRTRRDALRDVIERTEVPALTHFIGAIVQAEQLGVPIAKVLQVQSEQLRIERRQRAEEMANKAPIKMLLPLVGCIFPSLFIVLLGPPLIMIVVALSSN